MVRKRSAMLTMWSCCISFHKNVKYCIFSANAMSGRETLSDIPTRGRLAQRHTPITTRLTDEARNESQGPIVLPALRVSRECRNTKSEEGRHKGQRKLMQS